MDIDVVNAEKPEDLKIMVQGWMTSVDIDHY
jgi:hypothetical protein